jgi:predicted amidohydrolase YtcJ
MLPWWKEGFQIHVHSNGNGGNTSTLDALAALQTAYPRFDHRFTIEHFGMTTPEMARRLKALGAVASINPYYVYYRGEFNAPMLGTDRAYTAARLKTLLDAGNTISLHSDTPVGPPRPLEWVWIAVNRIGLSGKFLGPDERVSVVQAMKMITIDAAYTLGVEDKIGSIQAGKFADFTVLEQDPFEVEPMKLKDIPVWGTVLGGRVQPVSGIIPQPGLGTSQK